MTSTPAIPMYSLRYTTPGAGSWLLDVMAWEENNKWSGEGKPVSIWVRPQPDEGLPAFFEPGELFPVILKSVSAKLDLVGWMLVEGQSFEVLLDEAVYIAELRGWVFSPTHPAVNKGMELSVEVVIKPYQTFDLKQVVAPAPVVHPNCRCTITEMQGLGRKMADDAWQKDRRLPPIGKRMIRFEEEDDDCGSGT